MSTQPVHGAWMVHQLVSTTPRVMVMALTRPYCFSMAVVGAKDTTLKALLMIATTGLILTSAPQILMSLMHTQTSTLGRINSSQLDLRWTLTSITGIALHLSTVMGRGIKVT